MEEIIESTVNAEPVVNVEQQIDNQPIEQASTSNVSEGVVTPHVEEKPVQSAEENAKFAAIRREAEQKAYTKAQDELIASMYGESHGIYTKADYEKAVEAEKENQRRTQLQEKGIDPSIVDEYVNNNPTVKKAQELIFKQEHEAFVNNDNLEFLQYFEKENQRPFDSTKDVIPEEVWKTVEAYRKSRGREGKSLVDAYAKHELSVLRNKLAEYEKGSKVQQANASNAATSTGSLTGNGTATNDHISFDTFEANKNDSKWVMKNFNKIQESRSKW